MSKKKINPKDAYSLKEIKFTVFSEHTSKPHYFEKVNSNNVPIIVPFFSSENYESFYSDYNFLWKFLNQNTPKEKKFNDFFINKTLFETIKKITPANESHIQWLSLSPFPLLFLNLGKKDKINQNGWANSIANALSKLNLGKFPEVIFSIAAHYYPHKNVHHMISEIGSILALNRFNNKFFSTIEEAEEENGSNYQKNKSNTKDHLTGFSIIISPKITTSLEKDDESAHFRQLKEKLQEGFLLGQMTNGARELVSLPANELTPEIFGQRVSKVIKNRNIKAKIYKKNDLKKMGMNGILVVGQGSANEPLLIKLEYYGKPKQQKIDLSLVGKGITFDTGGISLKPAGDMHEMKGDMGGAAAMFYALVAIAEKKLPLNVHCYLALAENMPDGKAQRPGDVYTSYKGLTVEVLNTDAEGRLILADALAFAAEEKPTYLIDMATLTGAAMIALGTHLSALFCNQKDFNNLLFQAGEQSNDRVWPMPLYEDYQQELKSDIADLANVGPRWGGAITAATFLKNFVPEDQAWAHVDIAPKFMLKKDSGLHRKGATGFGVRLIYFTAKALSE